MADTRPDPLAEPGWMRPATPARPARPAADPVQNALDWATGGPPGTRWLAGSSIKDEGDTRCVVFLSDIRCWNERAWVVWVGCLNEAHLDKSDICEKHIELAMRIEMACQACWDETRQVVLARALKKERPGESSGDSAGAGGHSG